MRTLHAHLDAGSAGAPVRPAGRCRGPGHATTSPRASRCWRCAATPARASRCGSAGTGAGLVAAPDTGARWINARIETLAEKPAFGVAARARRCLVPADAFYEWADHGGFKQPYRIALADGSPFAFAGVWERWRSPSGDVLESCAIGTTQAGPVLRELHDRMPVLLPDALHAAWLDARHAELAPLLAAPRQASLF